MGITSNLEPVPSICLGTFDLSVYEMVGAYSTFVNKGIWIEPLIVSRIETRTASYYKILIQKQTKLW